MNHPASYKKISVADLQSIAGSPDSPLLLDVRSAADHEAARIPGSTNNCVYEIAFMDRMEPLAAPGSGRSVCVYGHGPETHDARMAAEKLVRVGYLDVMELDGGLEQWQADGGAVEGSAKAPQPGATMPDGRREINLAESRIEWVGRNLLNRHHGTLGIRSGHLDFRDGLPVGGGFVFDMNSIACTNLAGDPLHDVLVDHLRSHDFFDTAVHPESRYHILSARRIEGAGQGAPNLRIEGELTLKGRTLPLSLDAVAGFTPEGHAAAQAVVAFDRTLWDVIYGSGRFFRNLGMHLVNDLIEVQLRILTE